MTFYIDSIDQEAKKQGSWVDYDGDSSFLIASTSTHAFQEYFTMIQKPFKRQIDKGELDGEVSLDLLCKALAKFVLLDWKGIKKLDGTEVPYTEEAAKYSLVNNEKLREFCQEVSMDISNFEKAKEEEAVKN